MALTGYRLAHNSRENTACYGPGEPGALGFELGIIPCPGDGGRFEGLDWAIPGSENGLTVTCFDYQKSTSSTKPRADAQLVLVVTDVRNGGSYDRWLVPDDFTVATYLESCAAGSDPIGAVAIPAPIIYYSDSVQAAPTIPAATYYGAIQIPALTGGHTTYTITAFGTTLAGVAIVFAPTTSTGTTVALLAADMQTNWASELGTGTFVATGSNIEWHNTNGATLGFSLTQA